jgi:hypothetical protein
MIYATKRLSNLSLNVHFDFFRTLQMHLLAIFDAARRLAKLELGAGRGVLVNWWIYLGEPGEEESEGEAAFRWDRAHQQGVRCGFPAPVPRCSCSSPTPSTQ